MPKFGKFNGLTDVEGLAVRSHTDLEAVSGVTVVLCQEGAVGGVDVRGSAPGTRETDLLSPLNLVEQVQAVVLSGGSVYGLAAADGVVRWLAEKGCGFPLGQGCVAPIVPAAVLYDLGRGAQFVPPVTADWGRLACEAPDSGWPWRERNRKPRHRLDEKQWHLQSRCHDRIVATWISFAIATG